MEKTYEIDLRAKDSPTLLDVDESKKSSHNQPETAPRLDYLGGRGDQDNESGSEPTNPDEQLLDIAWKYKWLALLCVCVFPLGQNCGSS